MNVRGHVYDHARTIFFGAVVYAGLYLTSRYNYLLFHSLAEIFSIVVACEIFITAWNVRQWMDNNYLRFLGVVYLFIGGLDVVHTFAYKGMPIFPGYDANLRPNYGLRPAISKVSPGSSRHCCSSADCESGPSSRSIPGSLPRCWPRSLSGCSRIALSKGPG